MSEAIKICSHVYQVGGAGLSHPEDCCIYYIESQGEGAIIDAGLLPSDQVLKNISGLGHDTNNIRYLIITHGHIDHIGGASYLKDRLKAQVVAHQLDVEAVEKGTPQLTASWFYGVDYQPLRVDLVLKDDQYLPLGDLKLLCLHTPGHTPGSICICSDVEEKRVLFAQDVHGPFNRQWGSDMDQWKESMQTLLDLKADILCEGHFGIFRPADEVENFIHRCLYNYNY